MNARSLRPDRYSLWDTVACLGVKPTLGRLLAGAPRGVRLERARHRIMPFAKAAAAYGEPARSALKEKLGRLGEDYRRRAARWEAHLNPQDSPRDEAADSGGSGCLEMLEVPLRVLGFFETAWWRPSRLG